MIIEGINKTPVSINAEKLVLISYVQKGDVRIW